MKHFFSPPLNFFILTLLIFCPQEGRTSAKEEFLHVGKARVPIASFVNTLFSDVFKGKRQQVLAALKKHGQTDVLYKSAPFKKGLGQMDESPRNAFIQSLPFEDKTVIKKNIPLPLLLSLARSESTKMEQSAVALQENSKSMKEFVLALDDTPSRSLLSALFSIGNTPPVQETPFLKEYFNKQKGQVKVLLEELALQSELLKKAIPRSDDFYEIAASLHFLNQRLYGANNPTDHTLENCPDGLLFNCSQEISHLELTLYFLGAAAERETKNLTFLDVQFETAKDDKARQKRLAVSLNTVLLKRELIASSAVILGHFLNTEKKDDQKKLDAYVSLSNLFYEYTEAARTSQDLREILPLFHTKLCALILPFDFEPPVLLDMEIALEEVKKDTPKSTASYKQASKKLKEAEGALRKQADEQHSLAEIQSADLVNQAQLIAAEISKANAAGGQAEHIESLFKQLTEIKKQLLNM